VKATQHQPITIARVKATKGFEHFTDEEAQNLIDTYRKMALMTYEIFSKVPEHEQKQFIRSI